MDRSSAQVADKITLTLSVQAPAGVLVSFPESVNRLGEFDVTSVRETLDIPDNGGRQSVRIYELESLVAGHLTVPAIDVSYVDKRKESGTQGLVRSEPLQVAITSMLEGQTDTSQYRDIKGLVELRRPKIDRNYGVLATATMATLLAGAGIAFVLMRRRVSELSPEEWALAELRDLEARSDAGQLELQEFYTRVTDTVRLFVERQFRIAASRLTTAEFFQRVQEGNELEQEHASLLDRFLITADMVKFAGLEPNQTDCGTAIATARQFVQESARLAHGVDASAQEIT